jgi:uncharacterized protein
LAERVLEGFAPGRHLIDAYGRGGFRFAGMSHRGSILALPSGVRAWPVASARDLDAHSLDAVLAEEPRLEFLLLGTGLDLVPLRDAFKAPFRAVGISVDSMQTGPAARTYNILLAEDRRVGAALIAVD